MMNGLIQMQSMKKPCEDCEKAKLDKDCMCSAYREYFIPLWDSTVKPLKIFLEKELEKNNAGKD